MVAEVLVVTPDLARFLNQAALKPLLFVLEKSYDFDCPDDVDVNQMEHMVQNYSKRRQLLVESSKLAKYVERRKSHFPFMCD